MSSKFTARQVIQQGHKVDVFVLCAGGTKFGELHGLGGGGYALFFNDKPRLIPWMETDADAFTWTHLRDAMENAKNLWERRDASASVSEKPDVKPDVLAPPRGRRDGWVKEFVAGR